MSIERVTGEGIAAWSLAMTIIIVIAVIAILAMVQGAAHSDEYPTRYCEDGQRPVELSGEVWCTPIILDV